VLVGLVVGVGVPVGLAVRVGLGLGIGVPDGVGVAPEVGDGLALGLADGEPVGEGVGVGVQLGSGDGLAVREVLRYPGAQVTLVDLDPEMTRIFSEHPELTRLNAGALNDPRVRVVNEDAFQWLSHTDEMFDFVVADFPDPSNYAVGKLYTTAFYRLLARRMSRDGLAVVQSTSPMFARRAFWSIDATLRDAGFRTRPYHLYVPSFGEWGFILAGRGEYAPPSTLPAGLRFLTPSGVPALFDFPADMRPVRAEVNRLDDPVLVRYYDQDWKDFGA